MNRDHDWLTMFDGITAHWWGIGTANRDEIDRGARLALDATGEPQAVHRHSPDEPCVRGGGCYVLRKGEQ
jgi:hypothetical protein